MGLRRVSSMDSREAPVVSEADTSRLVIRPAAEEDVALVLALITELAEYERMADQVVATEADVRRALFGTPLWAEAVIAELCDVPVGFALFFHTFSTFLAKPGLYLEDLYVKPEFRGRGFGRRLLVHLAGIAKTRGCGRFEWSVLDWNETAIRSYRRAGAVPMEGWTVYRLTGDPLDRLAAEGLEAGVLRQSVPKKVGDRRQETGEAGGLRRVFRQPGAREPGAVGE